MKGLLYLNGCLLWKQCRIFLAFLLVLLAGSALSGSVVWQISSGMLAGVTIPLTLMNYEDRAGWDAFSRALPYSAAQLVSVKYLLVLALAVVLALTGTAVEMLRAAWMGVGVLPERFGGVGMAAALCVLGPALLLPILFRFGVEKGERVCVALTAVLLLLLLLISLAVQGMPDYASPLQAFFPLVRADWLAAALLAVSGAAFSASWLLSVRLHKRHL